MKLCAILPAASDQERIALAKQHGFGGTHSSISIEASDEQIAAVRKLYESAGLEIVQVGCYINPAAADEKVRQEHIERLKRVIAFADKLGARGVITNGGHADPSCPNETYSVYPKNWEAKVLDKIAESYAEAVKATEGKRVKLCLEPWIITPFNSPESLQIVLDKVNHPGLWVELDLVNLMTYERVFRNAEVINECFDRFGDRICMLHAKDTRLKATPYTYHMSEAVPGEGILDYRTLLIRMRELPEGTPLIIEHISDLPTILKARDYILSVAKSIS